MSRKTGNTGKQQIDIVFDGPPGPEAGRFVEVENSQGASIRFGEWVHRDDGYWVLRFLQPLASQMPQQTELQKVMRTNDLNRRAEVETILLDISSSKRDLPTREECKELALRLGVPEVWKESQLTESHCNCVVCYERGHEPQPPQGGGA